MEDQQRYKAARQRLLKAAANLKRDPMTIATKQPNQEENLFGEQDLQNMKLIAPPYDPSKLAKIVESNGRLSTCIEIYTSSIEGYGYEFRYLGTKEEEDKPEVLQELKNLQGFFGMVNESESFTDLRKKLRRDYETYGNCYVEIIRYNDGEIAALYRVDPRYVRLQAKQSEMVETETYLERNGKLRKTKIHKRFRKYAVLVNASTKQVRWFKEYTDPRKLDAKLGKYEEELGQGEEFTDDANEILHIRQGNSDAYGIPRWVGLSAVILGLSESDSINYDLFLNNAIPALAILVSSGRLTAESVEEIAELLENMKGREAWNRILLLEALSMDDTGNIDDKNSTAKVDFKELPQPNDSMFKNYIEQAEKRIMSAFRLPPMLTGEIAEYNRSSSSTSKLLTEDAVFSIERQDMDSRFNFTIMREMGAKYYKLHTVGPRLLEGSELIDSIGKLSRAGAISVDDSIKLSNRILELDTSKFNQPWSKIPVAVLLELIKKQKVTEIEGVGIPENTDALKSSLEKLTDKNDGYTLDDLAEDINEMKVQLDEYYSLTARGE